MQSRVQHTGSGWGRYAAGLALAAASLGGCAYYPAEPMPQVVMHPHPGTVVVQPPQVVHYAQSAPVFIAPPRVVFHREVIRSEHRYSTHQERKSPDRERCHAGREDCRRR